MFFIVRESCSFSIKVNVTGKIKRLKNRPYGYNYYAKNEGINRYLYSIDKADPTLGKQLFYVSPETSFIHPRGHERGWSQIAENFYGTTMGKTFSKRTLKLDAPPAIHVYGNAAVAEFDWHFTAVRRDNGQTQHTTGRESQVWAKIPNTGWRIVHVHYSGPAKTGVGEGY